eukprot:Em0016g650a
MGHAKVKDEQFRVIEDVVRGRDTFVSVPTWAGNFLLQVRNVTEHKGVRMQNNVFFPIRKISLLEVPAQGQSCAESKACFSRIWSVLGRFVTCILSGLEEVDTIDSQEGFALLTQGKALKNLTIIFPAILSELAVETYGNWGKQAHDTISRLASHLTIHLSSPKSTIVAEIYTIAAQICKHGLNDERCRDVELILLGLPLSLKALELFDIDVRNCESQSTSVDMTDLSWKQAQLSLSKGGLGPRSLMLRAPAAYIASVCSSEYSHQSHTHLVHAVEIFNLCVAPSEKISLDPLSSPMQQKALFSKLDDLQFHALFNVSSVADRALVLSISAPHSSSWLSVVPSEDLGLKLNQISAMLLSNGRLA